MSTDKTGGPAFPEVSKISASCDRNNCKTVFSSGGMTLRDYFAAKAMAAILNCQPPEVNNANRGQTIAEYVAQKSYAMADSMLKARES